MRIDKLAMTSREALQAAMSTAADAQAGAVEPIHLLSALLGAGERNISVIIERIGADPAQLARSTQDAIDHAPKVSGEGQQMGLSNELVRVIEKAEKKATKMGDSFVVTEHLLMALAEDKGEAGRVLRDAGVTKERMTLAITPAAKQMLAVGGLDPVFGARPLKRLVQREVVDAIAAAIIDGTVREGDQVTVDVDKDGGFTVVCDNTPAATYEVPDAE